MKNQTKTGQGNSLPKSSTSKLLDPAYQKKENDLFNKFDELMKLVIKNPSIYPGNIWLDIADAGYQYRKHVKSMYKI